MSRWYDGSMEPEPQKNPVPDYYGPSSETMYCITIYMTMVRDGSGPFPALYRLVVPDYNLVAVQDTLNSNGASYRVDPITITEVEGSEDDDDSPEDQV